MKMFFGAGRGGNGRMQLRSSVRTVRRPLRATDSELETESDYSNDNNKSFSTSTINPALSSSFSVYPLPVIPNWLTYGQDFESDWEYVNDVHDQVSDDEDIVFGFAPSKDEAESVVFAIQEYLKSGNVSDEDDEVAKSLQIQSNGGADNVHDAFRLLQTEPAVQKMVISLSSDKTVWDAVMNNEVVKELRASLTEDGAVVTSSAIPGDEEKDSKNAAMEILSRILLDTKAKVVELIEKVTGLVYNMFSEQKTMEEGITMDPFQKKLKTSFMLSIVVFVVVAVSRSRKA